MSSDPGEASTPGVRDTIRHLESSHQSALSPSGRGLGIGMLVIGLLAGFGGGFVVGQRLAPPPPPRAIEVPRPAAVDSASTRPVSPVSAAQGAPLDAPQAPPAPPAPVPPAQNFTEAPVTDPQPTEVEAPEVKEPVARTTAPRRAGAAGTPAERARDEPEAGPVRTPGQQAVVARPTVPVTTPATLRFDSRPAGAVVYVDDVRVGVTPMTLNSVSPGIHRVRLELAGHSPWTTSVNADPGAQLFVGASLE